MYTQSITREHRALVVIALDQSTSMAGRVRFQGTEMTKAEAVALITNYLLFDLIEKARRTEGVRDYYDIAVLGYSGDGVESLLDPERPYIGVAELDTLPYRRVEKMVERTMPNGSPALKPTLYKEWIAPRASGETPMYEALREVRELVAAWCANPANGHSFPPIVFHITDGELSDSFPDELEAVADQIKSLGTDDGDTLLLNIHLAPSPDNRTLVFPTEEQIAIGNRYARTLYDCSSEMPEQFTRDILAARGDHAAPPFRGMAYNASMGELTHILNIGSISVKVSA